MSTTTDDDAGTSTVRIATSPGYGTPVFHTDHDCRRWPADGRDISRADAARRGLRECSFCSGEGGTGGAPSDKYLKRLGVSVND